MASSIKKSDVFEKILKDSIGMKFKANSKEANEWFAKKAKSIGRIKNEESFVKSLSSRMTSSIEIGKMVMFLYDAKTKEELPYFDKFPLIFPIEKYSDGYLGLNFHYLPPKLRAILLDWLWPLANSKDINEKTKLKISYAILGKLARHPYVEPCIKRYLYSHVRSSFIPVDAPEWSIAIHLPTEKFTVRKTTVFKQTKKQLGINRKR